MAGQIYIVPSPRARMQVYPVGPDADGVRILPRPLRADPGAQVLFDDGLLGPHAARLPDVWILGEAVLRPREVRSQPKAGIAVPAVGTRGLGLHPVQQGEAQLFGPAQVSRRLFSAYLADRAQPIVVLRPVDQRDVALEGAGEELILVHDPAVPPEREPVLFPEEAERSRFERGRIGGTPGELLVGPEVRPVLPPE